MEARRGRDSRSEARCAARQRDRPCFLAGDAHSAFALLSELMSKSGRFWANFDWSKDKLLPIVGASSLPGLPMTTPPSADASTPGTPPQGIFLPSMVWTTDRATVAAEKKRLLALHQQLNAVVNNAHHADECATWHMMAEASLFQLDHDIDALFDWLEANERGVRRERPDRMYD